MSGFMGTRLSVPCPECGRTLNPTLEDVRMQRTIYCSGGHYVTLVDEGGGVGRIGRQLDDLTRTMRKAGFKVTTRRR
jgi:hypothetical protein